MSGHNTQGNETVPDLDKYKVILSTYLSKRSNRTHQWKKKWVVLRNCQLSYYKDKSEHKAIKVYPTTELLSVSEIKDSSSKYRFAVYTSKKVIHLRAEMEDIKSKWLAEIQALIEHGKKHEDHHHHHIQDTQDVHSDEEDEVPQKSESDMIYVKPEAINASGIDGDSFTTVSPTIGRHSTHEEYSGNEDLYMSSGVSDSSLPEIAPFQPPPIINEESEDEINASLDRNDTNITSPTSASKTGSSEQGQSKSGKYKAKHQIKEEFIHEGSLLRLRKRYNQWKKIYLVLTDRTLNIYKRQDDFYPYKKLLVSDIVDAIEIDPLSSSKRWCILIITPKKRIRFCAETEDEATQWLASLKTVIERRKRNERIESD